MSNGSIDGLPPAPPNTASAPPGWFATPDARAERWWDGLAWSSGYRARAGIRRLSVASLVLGIAGGVLMFGSFIGMLTTDPASSAAHVVVGAFALAGLVSLAGVVSAIVAQRHQPNRGWNMAWVGLLCSMLCFGPWALFVLAVLQDLSNRP